MKNQQTISKSLKPGNGANMLYSLKLFFANWKNFRGRSKRSEYWWMVLWNYILDICILILLWPLHISPSTATLISNIVLLVFIIPRAALLARRLNDTGLSPKIGIILAIVNSILAFFSKYNIISGFAVLMLLICFIISLLPTDEIKKEEDPNTYITHKR